MSETNQKEAEFPPQEQEYPGSEEAMTPPPIVIRESYRGSGKLAGKVALITGGDSGIGRSVAVHFAEEGADVAIVYLSEDADAEKTQTMVEERGSRCLPLRGDVSEKAFCEKAVGAVLTAYGKLDILVNNAAFQQPQKDIADISEAQLRHTFEVNIFGYFFMVQAALPHLPEGGSIIQTTSVTMYRGSGGLLDYASTKGAITAFTRSLAHSLAKQRIRVNGVAPGPIWTPLIPATFPPEKAESFGHDTLLGRAGQPCEVATSFVFLASDDGSYFTGQTLHPNGGDEVSS
ncbi:SDR family oxidoreductase [soil metagenome]